MKKHRFIVTTVVLFGFFLGVLTPQFAQGPPTVPEKPDAETRSIMVGLVRTINTAEVMESSFGSFASWPTLLGHQQEHFNEWLAGSYPRDPNVHFGSPPEILPGWNLRLIVQPDGQGYVVLLKDTKDKTGYAVLSDESGVIRECQALQ
jgi:hypothetical protein